MSAVYIFIMIGSLPSQTTSGNIKTVHNDGMCVACSSVNSWIVYSKLVSFPEHMPGNEAMVISQLMLPQFCLVLTHDHKPAAAVAPRLVGDEYRMPVGWTGRGQVNGEIGRLARK